MTITGDIVRNEKNKPQDKLADAELQFIGGELDAELLGFGIWQQRHGSGRNVTFPARPFMVNGERRNFALIRAVDDRSAEDRLRQLVLEGVHRGNRAAGDGNDSLRSQSGEGCDSPQRSSHPPTAPCVGTVQLFSARGCRPGPPTTPRFSLIRQLHFRRIEGNRHEDTCRTREAG